jgi:aldehyde:ferredoxin oxidoreductase
MTAGYAGKILRLNLTNRSASIIDTEEYEEWGGGHGIGSAIFCDLCKDKTIDGFDLRNIVTIMSSPLSGTLVPGVSGRSEVQGIGVQQYPIGWFTRSNFGGRFSGMLKAAGWDGIVIEGAADTPVWVNIVNDKVTFEDARNLWGLDTWETQQEIWKAVTGKARLGEWLSIDDAQTTQRPAVLCIGPAGENLSRSASLIHDAGNGAGQGGFGGVWGSKNLKAISVQGTGGIKIANPKALMDARLWLEKYFSYQKGGQAVPAGCEGCIKLCTFRNQKYGNGSSCADAFWYSGKMGNTEVSVDDTQKSSDLAQKYGVNICDIMAYVQKLTFGGYLLTLYEMGILGPGKAIDSAPLPWDKLGTLEFSEALLKAIACREGIGNDLAEGPARAAKKWGRLEDDLASGILALSQWGMLWHWSLPGVEWPFGSILGDRDIAEHDFEFHKVDAEKKEHDFESLLADGDRNEHELTRNRPTGVAIYPDQTAEQLVRLLTGKTIPYTGDPFMFSYAWQGTDGSNMAEALKTGIYSRHKAKMVAWHRHYTRFWKQSILYCDWMFSNFTSSIKPDHSGFTPEAEPRFLNAVTGKNLSFADGMEIGRKIWNLDRAIWILQGRHRDMEKPAAFLFKPGIAVDNPLPVYMNGKWSVDVSLVDVFLDESGVEAFKTNFYEFEGWDKSTGWPSRGTLEDLGLKGVADELESAGRLGSSGTYTGE